MKLATRCAICSQIAGKEKGDLLYQLFAIQGQYKRHVIFESERFAVIPSIGPLTVGHVLLCPKSHYTSFARLPEDFEKEYDVVCDKLTCLLSDVFDARVHIFEHGVDAQCSRMICSVRHAHQHFVPADVDVWDAIQSGIQWMRITPKLRDLRETVGAEEYLFYMAPERAPVVALAGDSRFESQFLRQVFAMALARPDTWNWRTHPLPLDIRSTFDALASHVR